MCLPGKLWRGRRKRAGKSTVARLLLRYADPDKGDIRIGGVDMRDMQTDTLTKQLWFVFQDNFLLPTR